MSHPFIAWDPAYQHPLPEGHRFPMEKYALLPAQLEYEGTVASSAFFTPEPLTEKELLLTHDAAYWLSLKEGSLDPKIMRKTGFPWSNALVEREVLIMGGTYQAALQALITGVGFNVAGGTHHAFADRGEGFCLLNDQVIAANLLFHTGKAKKIFIVDLDVHQGNGTAALCKNLHHIFTFSMHGDKNYPFHKESSSLDIPLPDGIDDRHYLATMDQYLFPALDAFEPDFIFYQAGVDILAEDALGRLGVSLAGSKARDEKVLGYAHRNHIPVCVSMGGGYAPQIQRIVEAHAQTYRLAAFLYF
jgi:acetoin utilization deacetylase AcuC-like enzyme